MSMENKAVIVGDAHCKDCEWPVIQAEWSGWRDYWGYCSNKSCKNHHGEPWGQCDPEFVGRT